MTEREKERRIMLGHKRQTDSETDRRRDRLTEKEAEQSWERAFEGEGKRDDKGEWSEVSE